MRVMLRALGLVAGLVCGSAAAMAAPGFSTGNVNMRAGPDTAYPRVAVIPRGQPVEIVGCLENQSWCDVIWGRNRGWVFGEYLGFVYQGRQVLVPEYAPVIGIPVVGFSFGNYWGNYYRGAPWWNQYGRWQYYQPRPRPGWGPPPPGPGPRPPGWWRPGYRPGPVYGPGPGPGYPSNPGWHGPGRPGYPPGQPGQPGWNGRPPGQPGYPPGQPGRPPGQPGQPGWQPQNRPNYQGQPGQPGRPVYQGQNRPPPNAQQQGQPQGGRPQFNGQRPPPNGNQPPPPPN